MWLFPFIHGTQAPGNTLSDLQSVGLGSVLDGWVGQAAVNSGQLKGTFMRKKYFVTRDFAVTNPLVTNLAALLVSSIQVASPGWYIATGEAAGSPTVDAACCVMECVSGFPSEVLLKLFQLHIPWRQSDSIAKQVHCNHHPDMGGPRSQGAWARETGTTACDGSHVLFLESHHGNMPGGWGMAPCFLPSRALSRMRAWSSGLVNTNLLAKVTVFKDKTRLSQQWEKRVWKLVPRWRRWLSVCKKTRPGGGPLPESCELHPTSLVSRCQSACKLDSQRP